MNRRGFLTGAAVAAAASLIAPEVLLSARRFFLPPRGGWPAAPGDYLAPENIAAMMRAVDNIAVTRKFTFFMNAEYLELGDVVSIKSHLSPALEIAKIASFELDERGQVRAWATALVP